MLCRSRRRRHEGRTAGCPAHGSARRRPPRERAVPRGGREGGGGHAAAVQARPQREAGALQDREAPPVSIEAMICIFAKPPVAGQVKTRLAAAIGAEAAARLARAFVEDTIESVQTLPWAQAALATTEEVEAGVPVLLQGEGDLGARIE